MVEDGYGVEMSAAEIASFLDSRGHGVLSIGGETPYAIPISYGYDEAAERFVFQFLWHEQSAKREHLDESDRATLTVYRFDDPDSWRSVVASGRLAPIEEDTDAAVAAANVFAPHAATVSLTVFERPAEELVAGWCELRIEEISGRQSPSYRQD
jgi:nitroimidazol reductase NimA-like FMN-containing flavoprotein (pyridoxamine 5'-phosphate oxidase superfamily)